MSLNETLKILVQNFLKVRVPHCFSLASQNGVSYKGCGKVFGR
jgi:hypothetical protein